MSRVNLVRRINEGMSEDSSLKREIATVLQYELESRNPRINRRELDNDQSIIGKELLNRLNGRSWSARVNEYGDIEVGLHDPIRSRHDLKGGK